MICQIAAIRQMEFSCVIACDLDRRFVVVGFSGFVVSRRANQRAPKFVEPMRSWPILRLAAEMPLADECRGIAVRFQGFGNGDRLVAERRSFIWVLQEF